jgi:hypothetical protein
MEHKSTRKPYNRKFPRRSFHTLVGLLYKGVYTIAPCVELGEGGVLMKVNGKLEAGSLAVINLFLPKADFVTVTAEIVYSIPSKNEEPSRYGLKFKSLSFESKRNIRDYIADKTENET